MEEDEDFAGDAELDAMSDLCEANEVSSLEEIDEDVNYEAAKDLEKSRWQGVVATCRR
jgi:hypothetical protein